MVKQIENLVGWWTLDGTPNDSSDNSNNGVWSGSETYGTGKQFTQAADFDGSSQVDVTASLSVRSVSFWVDLDANTTDLIKLSSTAKISIDGSDDITTTGLTNVNIYVTNILQTAAGTGSFLWVSVDFDAHTANDIELGGGATQANGRMGDVRMYSSVLTAQERISIFNNTNGNKVNDFTRILYEITPVSPIVSTGFDIASDAEIKINDDTEIDSYIFTVQAPYPVNSGDVMNYYDFNNNLIQSGIVRDIVNFTTNKRLVVFNYEILLQDKLVNDVFENIAAETLIQQIVNTFAPELTYIGTLVTGVTITRYFSENKPARIVIQDIIKRLPNVRSRIDENRNFDLFTTGTTTSTTIITNGGNASISESGWTQDTTSQVTRLTVVGEKQTPNKVQLEDGTGAQTTFVLDEIPVTIKVEISGVEQTLTVDGQVDGDFTLNKQTKTIEFDVAPASGTDNVSFTYDFELNITVEQDASLEIQNKFGIIEDEITRKFLTDMDDARDFAVEYLSNYSTPLLSAKPTMAFIDIGDLLPGNNVRVVDNINEIEGENIDQVFTIRSVTRKFSTTSLTIELGDVPNRTILFLQEANYNVKQLYEQDNNSTLVQKSQQFINLVNIDLSLAIVNPVFRTFEADTFYLEEDGSGTRNQMLNDGTGPVMRETGYDEDPVFTLFYVTEAGDQLITEAGDTYILD